MELVCLLNQNCPGGRRNADAPPLLDALVVHADRQIFARPRHGVRRRTSARAYDGSARTNASAICSEAWPPGDHPHDIKAGKAEHRKRYDPFLHH